MSTMDQVGLALIALSVVLFVRALLDERKYR